MFVNFTPLAAGTSRSPLVAQLLPTLKDKITTINREAEEKSATSRMSHGPNI
jgi:hypothetical protein